MKRIMLYAAFGAVMLAVVALGVGGCTKSGTEPAKRALNADSTVFVPDSVRGDTTYYSCSVRAIGATPPAIEERVWIFATANGYWHMRYVYRGQDEGWLKVPTWLSLYCNSFSDSLEAEEAIREIGGTVVSRTKTSWTAAFVVALPSDESTYVTQNTDYMRYLAGYTRRIDIFAAAAPSAPRFSQ